MKYTITAMLSTALLMFSGTSKAGIVPVERDIPVKRGKPYWKPISVMLGLSVLFLAQPAHSAGSHIVEFRQWADIVNVEAVFKTHKTTRNHCTQQNQTTYHSDDHNPSNEIIGAIIGGVVGNQLGKGSSNRNITTIIGAIGGGAVANKMEDGHTHTQNVTVCEPHTTVTQRRDVSHYIVTYRLNGAEFIVHEYQKPVGNEKLVTVKVTLTYPRIGTSDARRGHWKEGGNGRLRNN